MDEDAPKGKIIEAILAGLFDMVGPTAAGIIEIKVVARHQNRQT
jgi:hypothetical protein